MCGKSLNVLEIIRVFIIVEWVSIKFYNNLDIRDISNDFF